MAAFGNHFDGIPVAFTNPFVNSAAACQILLTNGIKNHADQETFSYTYVQRKNSFFLQDKLQ
jgi:hypothetical protein